MDAVDLELSKDAMANDVDADSAVSINDILHRDMMQMILSFHKYPETAKRVVSPNGMSSVI